MIPDSRFTHIVLSRRCLLPRARIPWERPIKGDLVPSVSHPYPVRSTVPPVRLTFPMHSSLNYAQSHLNIPPRNFISRIGLSNEASIGLFAKLGFGKEKVVEVFQEVTMRFGWVEGSEDGKLDETERLEQMRREKWDIFGQEIAC
jgi:hypothetical protein